MQCTRLTNANNIELKAPLQELLLDLGGDAVETNVALGEDALGGLRRLGSSDVGHGGGVVGRDGVYESLAQRSRRWRVLAVELDNERG